MDGLRKSLEIILVVIAFISAFIIAFCVYGLVTNKNNTTGIINIDDQVGLDVKDLIDSGNLSDDENAKLNDRVLFNYNLYSNENGNGKFLFELQQNYFTNYMLNSNSYRSSGMQLVSDKKFNFNDYDNFNKNSYFDFSDYYTKLFNLGYFEDASINMYDSSDGISYNGGNTQNGLKENKPYFIKIDNKPYELILDGEYKQYYYKNAWDQIFNKQTLTEIPYTYLHFFHDALLTSLTQTIGEGDLYLNVKLSDYFSVRRFNENTKQFEPMNDVDFLDTYVVIKIHYEKNGVTKNNQSLFGIISNDSSFNSSEINTDYFISETIYNLDLGTLEKRKSKKYNGNFIYCNVNLITELSEIKDKQINITIDLDLMNDIVGLDFDAFRDFEINTLKIISSKEVTFNLLDGSLINTNIKKLERTNNVKLIINSGSINNEYLEVVL